jgi:hypothetical protein
VRFLLLLLICCPLFVFSQGTSAFQKDYQLHITKTNTPVKIDGELNDAIWATAEKTSDFWRKYPTDGGRPKKNTVAQVAFDDKFFYVAFTVFDSGKALITSLKRDVGHDSNDGVAIILDPLNQKANGFFFVVNAYNAQSEDQLSPGAQVTFNWDNKWYSATKRYADRWTAEFAIPLKTLRYSSDKKIWGLNFLRVSAKDNEYSCWTKVPVNFRSYDLGYTGALIWNEPPPPAGTNVSVLPFVTADVQSDKENGKATKTSANAGFDSKIALNSSLNLDLTVNPDFSQVEVDRQVTNLTRFNIFFPEKRGFFLENSDLYSAYGIDPIRPFYSRRIGLDKNGNRIPILFGARLTGNITKSTRIGIMNMQTGRKGDYDPENYTAVTINQKVFKRSVIRGLFLNRQASLTDAEKKADPLSEYGRNAGTEFSYTNEKGTWNGWGSYHQSFKPGITDKDKYLEAGGSYNGRNFSLTIDLVSLGTNYYTDMGYVQRIENYDAVRDTVIRVGFKHAFTNALYKFFPKKGPINTHTFLVENYVVFNPNNTFNERNTTLTYNAQFNSTAFIFTSINNNSVDLLFPTAFTDKTPLPKGKYSYTNIYAEYDSDFRKKLSWFVGGTAGEFYNGTAQQVSVGLNFRSIPHINIGIKANYYKLKFPDPHGSTELFLVSPKIEVNFSTKIFWTTFLQYYTQGNNFNINSRFQWRYKPMSDLFLVYTDNYFTDPLFKNKNRAVVLKMNYWLNL